MMFFKIKQLDDYLNEMKHYVYLMKINHKPDSFLYLNKTILMLQQVIYLYLATLLLCYLFCRVNILKNTNF